MATKRLFRIKNLECAEPRHPRLLGESQAVQFLVQFSVQFSRQVSSLVRRSEKEWSVLVVSEMA